MTSAEKRDRALTVQAALVPHFLKSQPTEQRKTLDLRSHNLRVIAPGTEFYLAAHWGNNSHNVSLVQAVALMRFKGNHVMQDDDAVMKREPEHHMSHSEYLQLKSSWKRCTHVGCVGWEIELVSELQKPVYIPCNPREDQLYKLE